jgi:hypothetical protein
VSLSTCIKCGGHIPLGPDASNRCETCGAGVFADEPSPHASTVHMLNEAECRLARIAEIIEQVDARCAAVDGPVTPTLDEMTQAEISEVYRLAKSPIAVPGAPRLTPAHLPRPIR